jgi:hypothetical protein
MTCQDVEKTVDYLKTICDPRGYEVLEALGEAACENLGSDEPIEDVAERILKYSIDPRTVRVFPNTSFKVW